MIASNAHLRIERIPISQLQVVQAMHQSPCYPEKLGIYLDLLTNHPEQDVDPLIVTPGEQEGMYAIKNGRHRFVASIMACRKDVLCVIEESEEQMWRHYGW